MSKPIPTRSCHGRLVARLELCYGDAEYHVHGSQTFTRYGTSTTFWLAPGHGKVADS